VLVIVASRESLSVFFDRREARERARGRVREQEQIS
jgi:hypothetical protein